MRLKLSHAWALAALLTGCGVEQGTSSLRSGFAQLSFAEWCADWGLGCERKSDTVVEAEQMKAALAVTEAFLKGPSQLTVSREAMTSADFDAVLQRLRLDAPLRPMMEHLKASGFEAMRVQGGRGFAELAFQDALPFQVENGAWVEPGASVHVAPGVSGNVTFEGASLADPSRAKRDALGSWSFVADGTMTWSGQQNTVTGIPGDFIPGLLDIKADEMPDGFETNALLGSLPSLMNVLVMEDHRVQFDRNIWNTVLQHLDTLVEDAALRANVRAFLQTIDQVDAAVIKGSHAAVNGAFQGRGRFACESDGRKPVTVGLESQFGIQRVERLDSSGVRLTFFGTKVKSKVFGPIAPTITLKRVDVFPDKVIVRDIPILGSYTINLGDQSGNSEIGNFRCGPR